MSGLLCSQKCVPTSGSYYCQCYEGFILEGDGRSCRLNNMIEDQEMAFLKNSSILLTPLTSNFNRNSSSVITTPSSLIFASSLSLNLTNLSNKLTTVQSSTFSNLSSSIKDVKLSLNSSKMFSSLYKPSTLATGIKLIWSKPFENTLKTFIVNVTSRTTRSLPTEDNELSLPCPAGYRFSSNTETCDGNYKL
jgi:hypothetical protein